MRQAVAAWRAALPTTTDATRIADLDQAALDQLAALTVQATRLAGEAAAAQVNAALASSLRFDLTNPAAVAWTQANAARLVTGITEETQAALRWVVEQSLTQGLSIETVMANIRSLVGLTQGQAEAVESEFARQVASGASDLAAFAAADAYAAELHTYRTEVIARTEVIRSLNAGQELLWSQGVASGEIRADRMERIWITTEDERTCPMCGAMDGETTDIGAPWMEPGAGAPLLDMDGNSCYTPNMVHPNCRCGEALQRKED